MKPEPDYYAILQVDPHAEQEVVQAAYRRLAAKYHPDVNPSPESSERMKLLNAAYEVLSDPSRRIAYDMRRGGRQGQGGPAASGASRRRQPWWLLPLAMVAVALSLRFSPRLILVLGPLLLVLWLYWSRPTPNPK